MLYLIEAFWKTRFAGKTVCPGAAHKGSIKEETVLQRVVEGRQRMEGSEGLSSWMSCPEITNLAREFLKTRLCPVLPIQCSGELLIRFWPLVSIFGQSICRRLRRGPAKAAALFRRCDRLCFNPRSALLFWRCDAEAAPTGPFTTRLFQSTQRF
jgi:hypothetical protein